MFYRFLTLINQWFHLTFENEAYEKAYNREYLKDSFLQNKYAIAVGLTIYLSYIPLSYSMVPEDIYPTAISILLLPVLFSVLFLSFYNNDKFELYRPLALFVYSLVISLPPIILLFFTQPENYSIYIINMAPPIVAIFIGLGLSFAIAVVSATLVVLLLVASGLYLQVPILEQIHLGLLIASVYSLTAIGAYIHERAKRKLYLKQFKEEELIRETFTDPLTGLYNRRFLQREIQKKEQDPTTKLGVLLIDIDFFKKYNDHYGHLKGDEIIKTVAQTAQDFTELKEGMAFRYGGEEFVVFLDESNLETLCQFADHLRQKVEALAIEHQTSETINIVTLSIGVASSLEGESNNLTNLIQLADTRLYEAKSAGRNTVFCG